MPMSDAHMPPQPQLKPPRFQNARTITALVLREMGATYGATPGGYIWAVVQPTAAIFILSFAFSLLVRSPSLGTSFVFFYATGMLPFGQYGEAAGKVGASLRYAKALLAYPPVTWADAVLSRLILHVITANMVFLIVISGIIYFENTRVVIEAGPILTGLAAANLLGFGVGLNNAVLIGLFPVWKNIWQIVTRPLFIASAIIYIYEDLPGFAQSILWWNPLVHVTGTVRSGFYATYAPEYVSYPYIFGLALVLIFSGLLLMRSQYTEAIDRN